MLGEFLYRTKVYCIKSILDPVTPDEKEIKFESLKDAKQFFAYVASDPFAREELYEIAQWMRPTSCRPPRNCPQLTNQELVDLLCTRIYEGGLDGDRRLVELVAPKPKPEYLFEKCCVESIKRIDHIVDNAKLSGKLLCIVTVHNIFRSHRKLSTLISLLSTARSATDASTYEDLATEMLSLKKVTRKSIYDLAWKEELSHIKNNNSELREYWKRIKDASN